MTGSRDEARYPPYGPKHLADIAEALEVPALSAEHSEQLQDAAQYYLLLAGAEAKPKSDRLPIFASKRERRSALRRVAKDARALKKALEDRAITEVRNKLLDKADPDALDELATIAERLANEIPKGGPDPKVARFYFVKNLSEIFEAVKQRPASRRHDPLTGLDDGLFLEFARTALRPLNPAALKGLEHEVRDIVTQRSPARRS